MAVKLEDLSRSSLESLIELKFAVREMHENDALLRLLETSILLEGKKGRGKSLTATAICWQLRERFDKHIITVGSKMGLQEAFGPFQEITEAEFKDCLSAIQDVVERKVAAQAVVDALKEKGADLMYAVIVFDEAGKLFEARTPNDKLVRLFGYFMDQQRHYHCTTILCAPSRQRVDGRVRQQVDWYGRCFHNKWSHQCTVRLVNGLDVIVFDFDGADDTYHVPYYQMYDSWNLVGYRRSHLDIEKI